MEKGREDSKLRRITREKPSDGRAGGSSRKRILVITAIRNRGVESRRDHVKNQNDCAKAETHKDL